MTGDKRYSLVTVGLPACVYKVEYLCASLRRSRPCTPHHASAVEPDILPLHIPYPVDLLVDLISCLIMPHAVLLGASRGSGYHALLRLLTPDSDWTATLLLRKPEVIETDDLLRTYIEGGRLKIIKGDATEYGDVKRLFEGEKVDVVISSVGESTLKVECHLNSSRGVVYERLRV